MLSCTAFTCDVQTLVAEQGVCGTIRWCGYIRDKKVVVDITLHCSSDLITLFDINEVSNDAYLKTLVQWLSIYTVSQRCLLGQYLSKLIFP